MSETRPTLDEILATLRENFNVVGNESWVESLAKTAHSKNITTADWNAVLLKIAAAVSATEALKTAMSDLALTITESNAELRAEAGVLKDDFQALEQKTSELENSLNEMPQVGLVVPDKGNRNDVPFVSGTPGTIALYNRSSGLELRDLKSDTGVNYGPRLHVACANQDEIDVNNVNNPVSPYYFAYAMKKRTYKGAVSSVPDADKDLPPSVGVVKDALSAMGFKINLKLLAPKQSFTLPPSTFALVSPYSAQFKGTPNSGGDPSTIDLSGITLLWVTDKLNADMAMDANGAYYRCMLLTPSGISLSSKHYLYRTGCQIYNNHSSGTTYVYYVTT